MHDDLNLALPPGGAFSVVGRCATNRPPPSLSCRVDPTSAVGQPALSVDANLAPSPSVGGRGFFCTPRRMSDTPTNRERPRRGHNVKPRHRAGRLPGAGFANSWRSTGPALEQLPAPKVPSIHGAWRFSVNSSTCRSSRPLFLGVPLRTEQYRVQPPLRRQLHP
jgi:hypothetical protein